MSRCFSPSITPRTPAPIVLIRLPATCGPTNPLHPLDCSTSTLVPPRLSGSSLSPTRLIAAATRQRCTRTRAGMDRRSVSNVAHAFAHDDQTSRTSTFRIDEMSRRLARFEIRDRIRRSMAAQFEKSRIVWAPKVLKSRRSMPRSLALTASTVVGRSPPSGRPSSAPPVVGSRLAGPCRP